MPLHYSNLYQNRVTLINLCYWNIYGNLKGWSFVLYLNQVHCEVNEPVLYAATVSSFHHSNSALYPAFSECLFTIRINVHLRPGPKYHLKYFQTVFLWLIELAMAFYQTNRVACPLWITLLIRGIMLPVEICCNVKSYYSA